MGGVVWSVRIHTITRHSHALALQLTKARVGSNLKQWVRHRLKVHTAATLCPHAFALADVRESSRRARSASSGTTRLIGTSTRATNTICSLGRQSRRAHRANVNTIATCVEHAFSGVIFAEARLDNCAAQRQRRHSERMRQIKAMGGARKAQAEGLGWMVHRSTGTGFTPLRGRASKNSSRLLPLA